MLIAGPCRAHAGIPDSRGSRSRGARSCGAHTSRELPFARVWLVDRAGTVDWRGVSSRWCSPRQSASTTAAFSLLRDGHALQSTLG